MQVIHTYFNRHRSIFLYTFLFLTIFIIGYLPLWKEGFSLVWNIDGLGQYYPAFIYIGNYLQDFVSGIFNGQFVLPTYDLSIGMGEDIIGVLNYYGFGDPLNLLAIFVTEHNSAYLFSFMIVLRMWLSGISLFSYFNYLKHDRFISILGSLFFVFSAFSVIGGTRYVEWLSVLIYSPLVLLGVEKILNEKKYTVFLLGITYGALSGFYYLFMMSLAMAFYLLVRLIFKKFSILAGIKTILSALLVYLLGLLIAAPILIPAIQSYFYSERTSASISSLIMDLKNYLPVFDFDIIQYLVIQIQEPMSNKGGVTLIEIVAVLLLFFLPNNRKKAQCLVFLFTGILADSIPLTGYFFNAFGQTNDRWFFIIHLLFAAIFAYVFSEYKGKLQNELGRHGKVKSKTSMFLLLITIVSSVNIIFNLWGVYSTFGFDWSKDFVRFDDANIYLDSPFNYTNIKETDDFLFRVSNDSLTGINGRPENIAMLNDYYGLTYWYSIINRNTQELVNLQGDQFLNWRSFGFIDNIAMDTLSGVKYYLSRTEKNDPSNFQLVDTVSFNDEPWYIYENLNHIGLSYLVDKSEVATINFVNGPFRDKLNEFYNNVSLKKVSTNYDGNTFTIDAHADVGEELILSVPYHKNWRAYVNGQEVPIEKTNTNYMSVQVDSGENKIEFRYSTKLIAIGILCSIASILVYSTFLRKKLLNYLK